MKIGKCKQIINHLSGPFRLVRFQQNTQWTSASVCVCVCGVEEDSAMKVEKLKTGAHSASMSRAFMKWPQMFV